MTRIHFSLFKVKKWLQYIVVSLKYLIFLHVNFNQVTKFLLYKKFNRRQFLNHFIWLASKVI